MNSFEQQYLAASLATGRLAVADQAVVRLATRVMGGVAAVAAVSLLGIAAIGPAGSAPREPYAGPVQVHPSARPAAEAGIQAGHPTAASGDWIGASAR